MGRIVKIFEEVEFASDLSRCVNIGEIIKMRLCVPVTVYARFNLLAFVIRAASDVSQDCSHPEILNLI